MIKKAIPTVLLCLVTALSAAVFTLTYFNADSRLPAVTQLNYDLTSTRKPMTIGETLNFVQRVSDISLTDAVLSFCSEQDKVTIKDEAVTPVLTNSQFFENYNIDVERFDKNSAVISSKLALRVFFTTDAVGKTFAINGKEYKIAGVYDSDSSLFNDALRDNKERVYLHYESAEKYGKAQIQQFAFESNTPTSAAMEQLGLDNYIYTDLAEKKSVLADFAHITGIIIYVSLLIASFKIWLVLIKKQLGKIGGSLRVKYIGKSIKTEPAKYIVLLVTVLSLPAVFFAAFMLCDFSIYIIPSYMPDENIFDIPHYLQSFTEHNRALNARSPAGDACLLRLYAASFKLLLTEAAAFAVLFGITLVNIYLKIRKKL